MALYYRFKCAKQFIKLPMWERYISIGEFKDRIFESKIGRGRDFDLVITNAETNEDYVDESTLIPANSSLLIRRIPGWPRKPIVIGAPIPVEDEPKLKERPKCAQDAVKAKAIFVLDSEEWDEFFASNSGSSSSALTTVDDVDRKIQAPALELQQETALNSSRGSYAGGMSRRMTGRNIPPEGYVCNRCKIAGHFIQHCPTNGDPDYDVRKKVKAPRGIPKSMLIATPDGSYGLPDGKVAVLSPDDATFQKEVEGMPSAQRSVTDIPPQLCCKLCKKVMEYAVMTSKCCFDSFCDQCIRNYIISNSMCHCGATDILTDHLSPNLTLRNAINRIMESNNGGVKNNHYENALQIQRIDLLDPQAKVPSPGQSLVSNNEPKVPSPAPSTSSNKEDFVVAANKEEVALSSIKEDVVAQEKFGVSKDDKDGEVAKKPLDVGEKQWSAAQNLAAKNYIMSMAFAAYNPYWNWSAGIQPGMEGFMTAGPCAGVAPCMSYGVGPLNMSFGGFLTQEQCSVPPMMSTWSREFGASKAAPKRKRESLKEHDREACKSDISSKKFKTKHHNRSGRPSPDRQDCEGKNYKRYRDDQYVDYERSRHLHSLGTCH